MAQRYKVTVNTKAYNSFSLHRLSDDCGHWVFERDIQATNMEDAIDSAKNWIEWINQPAVEFEV